MKKTGTHPKLLFYFSAVTVIMLLGSCSLKPDNEIALEGEWMFRIDSLDRGLEAGWYNELFDDAVNLPGSMSTNGKGSEVGLNTTWTGSIFDSAYFKDPKYERYRQAGNMKIPFWLQPLKQYVGAAWYQKQVEIPSEWSGHPIKLYLERCHWETQVWVDGNKIGTQNLLGSPHIFDFPVKPAGGTHLITIRVDNRIKDINVGQNAHSISDHTQTNWNGIIGKIALIKKAPIFVDQVEITPDVDRQLITARISLLNTTGNTFDGTLQLSTQSFNGAIQHTVKPTKMDIMLSDAESVTTIEYSLGEDMLLWDEFTPNLYELNVQLKDSEGVIVDEQSTNFGMRKIESKDGQILVNGRQIFLRGTLECAIFPKTGFPAMDLDAWKRIYQVIKSYGLNHVRFHSWCPPQAAFDAADQTGIYLQVENSLWANWGTELGSGLPIDEFLYKETEYNLKNYGNHPSFCFMSHGNEPSGRYHVDYLRDYVEYFEEKDSRRLYTAGAAWPAISENHYQLISSPRIQQWEAGLTSIINSEPPQTLFDFEEIIMSYDQPVVSHEIGQWCVYPNFNEIEKYDGVLRARNFEIFRETLEDNKMLHLADSFLLASGKLQTLCYKADIEAALRTKGMAGFQLLDLHDFPGQGSALVGVLDPFWDEKGYVTAHEYSKFCNATVPLARIPKRVFLHTEEIKIDIEAAHFGKEVLVDPDVKWTLTSEKGDTIRSGSFSIAEIPIGNGIHLGKIELMLSEIQIPQKLKLTAAVNERDNSWDLWVYPSRFQDIDLNSGGVKVVQDLNQEVVAYLEEGGDVLLTLKKGSVKNGKGGEVAVGFSSIFWNTAWTNGQAPHTLGILCNPEHPALSLFPTEYHSNWQWWDAMSHADAINLADFDSKLTPIVRIIDDWFTNRPLGLIFELKVGKGKILVTGADLITDSENRIEAVQLLKSLLGYMESDNFRPTVDAEIEDILGLLN